MMFVNVHDNNTVNLYLYCPIDRLMALYKKKKKTDMDTCNITGKIVIQTMADSINNIFLQYAQIIEENVIQTANVSVHIASSHKTAHRFLFWLLICTCL